ncbi:hypothetical protein EGK68_11060 [Enterobacter cloacae]|uniref:Uncharacterized protein n=1 Tax=Enterobacter cloacae TaxID=550 RepID=A0A3R9A401_ENTCL|nr:hypothetical protein EGK68_11060 [Enterobacter cloacae]
MKQSRSACWLAVKDVAAKNVSVSHNEYAGASLGRFLGVSRQSWHSVYAKHWLELKFYCDELDIKLLEKIFKVAI